MVKILRHMDSHIKEERNENNDPNMENMLKQIKKKKDYHKPN